MTIKDRLKTRMVLDNVNRYLRYYDVHKKSIRQENTHEIFKTLDTELIRSGSIRELAGLVHYITEMAFHAGFMGFISPLSLVGNKDERLKKAEKMCLEKIGEFYHLPFGGARFPSLNPFSFLMIRESLEDGIRDKYIRDIRDKGGIEKYMGGIEEHIGQYTQKVKELFSKWKEKNIV